VLEKVLVANRGEVAVRVIRALRALGVASVAVYSEPDAGAPHARLADEAHPIGPGPAAESYLDARALVDLALRTGCDAVHPGYGFLSENAAFAERCAAAGLAFVGPAPDAIEAMGSKTRARELVARLGIPVVPGSAGAVGSARYAREAADEIGYPVAVKAAGGGGGMGFRVAADGDELEAALDAVREEGARLFGDPAVYLERYFEDPRHVEVQVLADGGGGIVHLGERDCTVQRRHQKLVEEAPAPTVGAALRARLGEQAVRIARSIGYASAGTIEGLLVGDDFYFLEMNTRLQVEHPVTEMTTGIDLVAEQLRIASGLPLGIAQQDVRFDGAAIECRINAEAAHLGFMPSPRTITAYREPSGPGVRVDSGVELGFAVPSFYDSLLAKVIVHAESREAATERMLEALADFELEGPDTLIPFHRHLLATPQWRQAGTARDLLGDRRWLRSTAGEPAGAR
jgi:acetyl-CoA/propionyl-CoA carboxylase, biotin carboxylase, biotin carboxyl carrier protein